MSSAVEVEDVVRRYYRVAGDLTAGEAQLAELLAPDVRVVEHPNAITPHGAVRGRDEVLAAFRAGRSLLSAQEFVVDEVLVDCERAAVRARWSGTVGTPRGPLAVGDRLEAAVAAFVTVSGGRILRHETFDCHPPLR